MLKPISYGEPTELDRLLFERMVPADHYLRRVKAAIDFEFVREVVADCYSASMGRPGEDPVRMLKLIFLQFQYDLSDADVIEQARVNIAFRYFLDLSTESRVPSASLVSDFRVRLGPERFKRILERVVGQAREMKLVKDRLRLKDATHVIANVAVPSTIALVAQMRQRLLDALRAFVPEQVGEQEAEAELIRVATSDLKDAQRLLARVEQLRRVVALGDEVLERAHAKAAARSGSEGGVETGAVRAVTEALERAHKVLSDREEGAKDKLVSLVDPDARVGKHGQFYDGYMLDVLLDADSELITAIEVAPANADEAAHTEAMIESEEAAHGNDIEAISIDSIGYRGDVLERLIDAEDGPKLAVYVPPYKPGGAKPDRFRIEQFILDEQTGMLRCPGGQQTGPSGRKNNSAGTKYYFKAKQCGACPLREQCLGAGSTSPYRIVVKNDYETQYLRAQDVARTAAYEQVRRQHPRIERKLADMIRNHGGRRVRYWGRARARIQYFATAVVVNIKRIVNHLLPAQQAQTA